MAKKLITPPTVSPVTLVETKAHLNVNFDDDDTLIELFIKAATDTCEQFTGRAFIDQTWELILDEFPDAEIKLPMPRLISVTSVKYDDAAGDEQTLATTEYYVDDASEPGWIVPVTTWPTTLDAINAVRIRFQAGFEPGAGSPSDLAENVPFAIKAAILMTIGTLYAHRETVVIGQTAVLLPWAAEQMLRQYRLELALA